MGGETVDRYRLVVLGSSKVGKTSIITRYLHKTFNERYKETVEDIYARDFHINGSVLPLNFYDTNFYYPDMRKVSISAANAFLLVFAVDDVNSFKEVTELIQEVFQRRPDAVEMPLVLVGNKSDVENKKIYPSTVQAWLSHFTLRKDIKYIECSAKTEENIVTIFKLLLEQSNFLRSGRDRMLNSSDQNIESLHPAHNLSFRHNIISNVTPLMHRRLQSQRGSFRKSKVDHVDRDSSEDSSSRLRRNIAANRTQSDQCFKNSRHDSSDQDDSSTPSSPMVRNSQFYRTMSNRRKLNDKDKNEENIDASRKFSDNTKKYSSPESALTTNELNSAFKSLRLTRHVSLMRKNKSGNEKIKHIVGSNFRDESDCKIS